MGQVREDSTMATADLVQADNAAEAVKASGGGDIAVLNARTAELDRILDRAEKSAGIERDAAYAKSQLWDGPRGVKMRETADKVHRAAIVAARKSHAEALDTFSLNNGFVSMVAEDQRLAILGRRAEKLRAEFAELFGIAHRAGIESIPTETGRSWNVAEMVEFYSAPMPTPTETAPAAETNATETAAA